jgi:putative ABC transport system ATP-binding protein
MSVLTVEHVSKAYRRGRREFVALRDVSMSIEQGELVMVLGTRNSGCSTLMRVAAGLERPDSGVVRLDGRELSPTGGIIRRMVSYCHTSFSAMEGEHVLEHVMAPLLAQGSTPGQSRLAAERALQRTSVAHCAGMHPDELDGSECVRVAVARALVAAARILVLDDPTADVGALQAEAVLGMLRSLASDEGLGLLVSTNDAMCISGADRAMLLDKGKLRGDLQPARAEVLPLVPRSLGFDSHARSG